jgi:predicted DNA-binding protein
MPKNQTDTAQVKISRDLDEILNDLKIKTGRSKQSLVNEAMRTGMKIKHWLPETEPEPVQ